MQATKIRSLQDLPGRSFEQHGEKLILFILTYHREHNKQTPAYSVMANEIGATEEYVKSVLRYLENKGKIHFISRNPPAIMLTDPSNPDGLAGVGAAKPGAYDRLLSAEGQRHQLARYIGVHERDYGAGPSLAQMSQFIGISNLGYVQRMVEILIERKLVLQDPGCPPRLTTQAKELYNIKTPQRREEDKPIVVVRSAPSGKEKSAMKQYIFSEAERMRVVGEALADFKRKYGLRFCPTQSEWAELAGWSRASGSVISEMLPIMIEEGLVEARPKKSHKPVQFTEKGLRRFMPELFVEPEAQPEPPAQPPVTEPEVAAPEPIQPEPTAAEPAPELRYHDVAPAAGSVPYFDMSLQDYPDGDLVVELINRGYTVKKG